MFGIEGMSGVNGFCLGVGAGVVITGLVIIFAVRHLFGRTYYSEDVDEKSTKKDSSVPPVVDETRAVMAIHATAARMSMERIEVLSRVRNMCTFEFVDPDDDIARIINGDQETQQYPFKDKWPVLDSDIRKALDIYGIHFSRYMELANSRTGKPKASPKVDRG